MPSSASSSCLIENRTCLIVIDGWGLSGHSPAPSDAISASKTPVMTDFLANYPNSALKAHGLAVGLPDGLMGNSEVGHLNLGAGRVVFQDIVRIDTEIREGRMECENPVLSSIYNYCVTGKKRALRNNSLFTLTFYLLGNKRIHLVGLVSDGGVHSHLRHLKSLIEISKRRLGSNSDVKCFIHAITDGRDTAPCSAKKFLVDELGEFLVFEENAEFAKLGSVCGRYYAMDRDKRWERTQLAYDAITTGNCERSEFQNLSKVNKRIHSEPFLRVL